MKIENFERAKTLNELIRKREFRIDEIKRFPCSREGAKVSILYGSHQLVFESNEIPLSALGVANMVIDDLQKQVLEYTKEFESL